LRPTVTLPFSCPVGCVKEIGATFSGQERSPSGGKSA
jgi:hypothetical protein